MESSFRTTGRAPVLFDGSLLRCQSFLRWKFAGQGPAPHCELDVRIDLDGLAYVQDVAYKLRHAGLSNRWSRISEQEGCELLHHGIDWTVFRQLLKSHAKQPLVATSIRMLAQGAIKRKGHGGESLCEICGWKPEWVQA